MIQHTTDYDMFSYIDGNRDINKYHVEDLVLSIQEQNLLEDYPIVVNKKHEIIDGQHRLEAARTLNIPVFYKVSESGGGLDVVISVNNTSRRWTVKDRVNSYIKRGYQSYQDLQDYVDNWGIGYGVAVMLSMKIASNSSKEGTKYLSATSVLRNGQYLNLYPEHAHEVLTWMKSINKYNSGSGIKDAQFARAIQIVIENGQINLEQLIKKFEMSGKNLTKQVSTAAYLRHLEDVANFHNKIPVRIY